MRTSTTLLYAKPYKNVKNVVKIANVVLEDWEKCTKNGGKKVKNDKMKFFPFFAVNLFTFHTRKAIIEYEKS